MGGGGAAPRTIGAADLFFYASATSLSIRWISAAAAAGPASLPLWAAAVLLFGGPLVIATAELTGRFDHEGGVYAWTASVFGPCWGFLTGWLYWVSNLPFFASVLVFMVSLAAPGLGPPGRTLTAEPALFAAATVVLALGVGAAHLAGLGTGKWISNVGGASNFVLVAVLALTALGVLVSRGSATDFVHASYAPRLDATGAILWATMVFAIVGPESLAFLRNDVRGGMRTILG